MYTADSSQLSLDTFESSCFMNISNNQMSLLPDRLNVEQCTSVNDQQEEPDS